jgi:hypothetical protein
MANERILELIRKEEVVLFVGAGMSYNAGYPLGGGLARILYDKLTDDDRADIEFTDNLPKICEDIYTMKGKNKSYLIETLREEFKRKPKNTETHELLAGIPHFKNIITTNYDTLIETANPNIEVIRKSVDLSTTNRKKQLLFKIHSDFSDIDRLILTESDYSNYFTKDSEKSIFWNAVKDRLGTNHILFIGYSLEDSNVNVMINKIKGELGEHGKEIYFVSPKENPVKLKSLSNRNINYIQSTGEEFIKEVAEDIRKNYLPGLGKGIGNADTALALANLNDLNLELTNKGEKIVIRKVKSNDASKKYTMDFKVNLPDEEKDKFLKFFNNQSFDQLKINQEFLKEFSFFMSDLRIHNEDNITSIILEKQPKYDCTINIVFEDEFEVDNYPFKLTAIKPSETETLFQIVVNDFTVIMELNSLPDGQYGVRLNKIPSKNIKSTNSGLQFYEIISRITSNLKFKIFKDGKIFFTSDQFTLPFTEAYNVDHLKNYFKDLKKIEKHFNVKFTEINLDEAYENRVKLINMWINNIGIMEKIETIGIKCFDEHELEIIKNAQEEGQALIMATGEKELIQIHGLEFDLGFRFKVIYDLEILNKESLEDWKNIEIIIKSKTNCMGTFFSPETELLIA